jgi:hypothetical protein
MNEIAPRKKWGELGPAMRALPNDQWRAFVELYLTSKPGYGAATNAYRRAGFSTSLRMSMHNGASRLMRDDRIVAAIAEESRKIIRSGAPEAVAALLSPDPRPGTQGPRARHRHAPRSR